VELLTLSVETRQRAEGRGLQGKEEGCKAKGNNDCLGGHDIKLHPSSFIFIDFPWMYKNH
jgi:hypothetical protein